MVSDRPLPKASLEAPRSLGLRASYASRIIQMPLEKVPMMVFQGIFEILGLGTWLMAPHAKPHTYRML